jgi:hypothetical protein
MCPISSNSLIRFCISSTSRSLRRLCHRTCGLASTINRILKLLFSLSSGILACVSNTSRNSCKILLISLSISSSVVPFFSSMFQAMIFSTFSSLSSCSSWYTWIVAQFQMRSSLTLSILHVRSLTVIVRLLKSICGALTLNQSVPMMML